MSALNHGRYSELRHAMLNPDRSGPRYRLVAFDSDGRVRHVIEAVPLNALSILRDIAAGRDLWISDHRFHAEFLPGSAGLAVCDGCRTRYEDCATACPECGLLAVTEHPADLDPLLDARWLA